MSSHKQRSSETQEGTVKEILDHFGRPDLLCLCETKWWATEIPSRQTLIDFGFEYHERGRLGELAEIFGREGGTALKAKPQEDFQRKIMNQVALFAVREYYNERFSFAVPCRETIDFIVEKCPRILEVGAGTGFWAWLLTRAGGDVIATDWFAAGETIQIGQFCDVLQVTGEDAVAAHPDRDVLCVWPYLTSQWLAVAAERMEVGRRMIFIGEGPETCGHESFHDVIEDRTRFEVDAFHGMVRFYGINDRLLVLRKIA